jgi:hypothetical protein
MSQTENTETGTETPAPEAPAKKKGPSGFEEAKKRANLSRRTLRELARKKRRARILSDKEYAKALFEARSKRSVAKKAAYRKKKSGKKAQTTG